MSETIHEINEAARASGLSYGQYVNQTEAPVTPRPTEEPAEEPVDGEERNCPQCGKTFLVESRISRKKYCSVVCRQAAAADRQKARYQEQALARMEAEAEETEAPPRPPARESILARAQEIYQGNRAGQYGRRERNFEAIAGMWAAYLGRYISPADVAAMMALLKVARMGSGHYKEDNYVDAVNYLLFAAELGGE